MDALTFGRELESRGFSAFSEALGDVSAYVSAAYARRGDMNDLVLVADTTDPEAGPGDPTKPHRVSRRLPRFAAPLEDVVRLARALPTSFFAPLARITIVEIADGPPSIEDTQRLAAYVTPPRGQVLVGAIRVDEEHKVLHANDGLSPKRTRLMKSDEPIQWVKDVYGATVEVSDSGEVLDHVPLFGPRAVGGAALLCSPIAGASLLGWNLHRTRRTGQGVALVAVTALVVAGLVAAAEAAEGSRRIFTPLLTIGSIILFSRATRVLVGDPVKKAALWLAVLLSLGSIVTLFAVAVVPVVAFELLDEQETRAENGGKVVFDHHLTPEKAKAVAALLQERGVLDGPESGVNLRTEGNERQVLIQFPDPHTHERPDIQRFYRDVARDLSRQLFAGATVAFVFQSSLGVELGKVSSTSP